MTTKVKPTYGSVSRINPALKTLTRQQFEAQGGKDWQKYLNYVAKRRKPPGQSQGQQQPVTLDPLAPTPEPVIRRQVRGIVDAQVNPLLDELDRYYGQRAESGQEAITGYTGMAMERLAPLLANVRGAYDTAKSEQAEVDAALSSFLSGQGAAGMEGLAEKLNAIGAPQAAVDTHAGGVGETGTSAANVSAAMGASMLQRLIGQGAADETLVGSFPGLMGLEGLRSSRLLGSQLNQEAARERGQITSQVPGMLAQALDAARNREVEKATAVRTFGLDERRLGEQAEQYYAGLAQDQSQFEAGQAQEDEQFWADLAASQAEDTAAAGEDARAARADAVNAREDAKQDAAQEAYRRALKAVVEVTLPPNPNLPRSEQKERKEKRPKKYSEVFRQLESYVAAVLRRYNVRPEVIRQIVADAMGQSGMWPRNIPAAQTLPGQAPGPG